MNKLPYIDSYARGSLSHCACPTYSSADSHFPHPPSFFCSPNDSMPNYHRRFLPNGVQSQIPLPIHAPIDQLPIEPINHLRKKDPRLHIPHILPDAAPRTHGEGLESALDVGVEDGVVLSVLSGQPALRVKGARVAKVARRVGGGKGGGLHDALQRDWWVSSPACLLARRQSWGMGSGG